MRRPRRLPQFKRWSFRPTVDGVGFALFIPGRTQRLPFAGHIADNGAFGAINEFSAVAVQNAGRRIFDAEEMI